MNGSVYVQDTILARTRVLGKSTEEMHYLLELVRKGKEGDMDLRAALRWAGWNPQTQIDEAVEYLNFDFLMGIEPDKLAAHGIYVSEGESDDDDNDDDDDDELLLWYG